MLNTGILQPDRIYHTVFAFGNSWCGITEAGVLCGALKRKRAENVYIVKILKLIAESECAACGNNGIIHMHSAKINGKIYHIISSLSSTGPSLQIRLLPYFVWHEQPMQAPKPQPIRSSKLY